MHLPEPALAADPVVQRRRDRARLLRAFNASLCAVLLLAAVYSAQGMFDVAAWAVTPRAFAGLRGVLFAPLLHGSAAHLAANAAAVLLLGTLAGCVYPRATLRALPLLWLGAGLGAWMLGAPGTHHLGASGVNHGLAFLVFTLAVLRRDRAAIAAAMLAFAFFGGMLLSVLPQAPDVSWESHLGGALAGVLAGWWLRATDPALPRHRYSWELEENGAPDDATHEVAHHDAERGLNEKRISA
ncbi:MAG: rhomboid family intramembrane serine protease [Lysobacter sp.]|nr:rhomboid family intramembrane serine protease [Lysobacter sp.]